MQAVIEGESAEGDGASKDNAPPLRDLLIFPVVISVSNYAGLGLVDIALSALLPLFYSSSINNGGLGLDPFTIGTIIGSYGIVKGTLHALFFSKIIKRWGAKKVYMIAICSYFVVFPFFPVISFLAKNYGRSPLVWVFVYLQLATAIVKDMAYGKTLYLCKYIVAI